MKKYMPMLYIGLALACLTQLYFTNPPRGMMFLVLGSISAFGAAITSRARSRDHVMYHFVASIISNFAFFLTFQQLIQNRIPLSVILPYTLGTSLGRISGSKVAMPIERLIKATADSDKEVAAKTKLCNALYVFSGLVVLMVIQVVILKIPFYNRVTILTTIAAFFDQMSFSMRTWAQNRNKGYLIVIANICSGLTYFFLLGWLFKFGMPWAIFLPFTLSNTAGSICGTLVMAKLGKKSGASADTHVKTQEIPKFSPFNYYTMLFLVIMNFLFFDKYGVLLTILLIAAALLKSIAFTIVSRAGSRDNVTYHFWSAMASNGIWFISAYILVGGANMDYSVLVPYVCAFSAGGLLAVSLAMRIEKKIGALADGHLKPKLA